jgi:hypothetical protein
MNQKLKIIYYFCFCLYVALFSCTANFEKYNTHPTDPSPDDMTTAEKVGILFPGMLSLMHFSQENDNQMIEQMVGNQYGGYMTATNKWDNKNFGTFNPVADWVEQPFVRTFHRFYANYLQVRKITGGEGYIYAWANIVRVAVMLRVTDTYGPIPYSNIDGGHLSVEYDAVQDIYHHMINDLNSSIFILSGFIREIEGRNNPMTEFDPVYKGDFSKWIKFANSLKLRMAVRIGLVDTEYAVIVMTSAIKGGVIESNDDNAFLPTNDNPYHKSAFDWKDLAVSATLSACMNGWNDPRRPVYMTMTSDGTYRGVRMGIENIEKEIYGGTLYSKPNFKSNSPLPVYCAAETYFLSSEAALKGWISGDAGDLYEQGILTSMEQHAVSIGAYLSVTANPEQYHDPHNEDLSFDLSAPSSGGEITVAWSSAATDAAKLEAIIAQKWIAGYPLGFEAWCDFRRTGYPRLMPAVSNLSSAATGGRVNNPWLMIDPNSPDPSIAIRMARRLPYPVSEYNENPVHVRNAVRDLLDGTDEFSTDLWWAKRKE